MGVEIEITPAGKSTKRLTLLSGGEKSMTALAFLFAVFLARPCPFYILDEVEAALDDLNIDRFLKVLRSFAGRAQFIVVTHQKRTMEAADSLYGVSMAGNGVSKVISRRLPRAVEDEARMSNGDATFDERVDPQISDSSAVVRIRRGRQLGGRRGLDRRRRRRGRGRQRGRRGSLRRRRQRRRSRAARPSSAAPVSRSASASSARPASSLGLGNVGCAGCVGCIGCVNCSGCVGCIGCVNLTGAVGKIGVHGMSIRRAIPNLLVERPRRHA